MLKTISARRKPTHGCRSTPQDTGFVERYPKGKESITGIDYEPWHYRYVGKEHAQRMNELNMCLEEYVAFLKGN